MAGFVRRERRQTDTAGVSGLPVAGKLMPGLAKEYLMRYTKTMSLLIKVGLIVGVLVIGGFFAYKHFDSIRQNVTEFVNPIIKEERLVTELNRNIKSIQALVDDTKSTANVTELKQRIALSKKLLDESASLVNEISATNKSTVKSISANVSSLTSAIIGKITGREEPPTNTPTVSPTPLVCPPTPSK